MIDHPTARAIVERLLDEMPPLSPGDSYIVVDEATIERSWGWVFCYDSRRCRDTGDWLLGNAPYIVRRTDGAVFETGTALPIEDYIRELRLQDS